MNQRAVAVFPSLHPRDPRERDRARERGLPDCHRGTFTPSPPQEERVGERRPLLSSLHFEVHGVGKTHVNHSKIPDAVSLSGQQCP